MQRRKSNGLAPEIRELALEAIREAGGLEYARGVVVGLQSRGGMCEGRWWEESDLEACEETVGTLG